MGLGIHREDEAELKEDPATVDSKELPVEGVEGQGVDIGGEEATELAEDLLDSDTTAALGVWEEFNEEGWLAVSGRLAFWGWENGLTICKCVVAHVVTWVVGEVEEQGADLGRAILDTCIIGHTQPLETNSHRDEH